MIRIIIILFFSLNAKAQDVNFRNYNQLHKKNTKINISNKRIHPVVLEDSIQVLSYTVNLDSSIFSYRIGLNKKLAIQHLTPDFTTRFHTFEQNIDTLSIMNTVFCIQETLLDTNYIYPIINKILLLKEKKIIYLVVNIFDYNDRTERFYKTLIFNISDKNNIVNVSNKYCNIIFASDTNYMGDFNKDGIIDFCFICDNLKDNSLVDEEGYMRINVYNISNNNIFELKNYYLFIKGNNDHYFIDTDKSKWFYKIKKTTKSRKFNFKPQTVFYLK
jgi:hypothetical protein